MQLVFVIHAAQILNFVCALVRLFRPLISNILPRKIRKIRKIATSRHLLGFPTAAQLPQLFSCKHRKAFSTISIHPHSASVVMISETNSTSFQCPNPLNSKSIAMSTYHGKQSTTNLLMKTPVLNNGGRRLVYR